MGNKKATVIKTRSSFSRRKFMGRRSVLKHGCFCYNPERRVNMIKRRMVGDRRKVLSEIMNTFWAETD